MGDDIFIRFIGEDDVSGPAERAAESIRAVAEAGDEGSVEAQRLVGAVDAMGNAYKNFDVDAGQVVNHLVDGNGRLSRSNMLAAASFLDLIGAGRAANAMLGDAVNYGAAFGGVSSLFDFGAAFGGAGKQRPSGIMSGLLGGMFGGFLGGRGGGLGGALGMRGIGLPFGAGAIPVASFGTLGALAGFGLEHYFTILIGLAGSLAGAVGGLGVIALGTFGTMAVGMGSDMAVMKSVISDTQSLMQAQNAVNQAALVYGTNSTQYQIAQQRLEALKQTLGNTAGVAAELNLANALSNLNGYWDKATSQARVAAVNLIMPFVQVAQQYIPLIGNAATQNFGIIREYIQPLIDFLNGPGKQIFQDLENTFAANLPTATNAFVQGLELLLKTMDFASQYTGGLVQWLDALLTRLNSNDGGFQKWEGELKKLIGIFDVWKNFVVAAVHLIFDVFSNSKGLGTGIIGSLTVMINKLDQWVKGPGHDNLKKLFEVHKKELLAILQLLPALGPFAKLYLQIAIPLAQIVTLMAQFLGFLLKVPGVGGILGYGLAIDFLLKKALGINILGSIFTKVFGPLVSKAAKWAADMALQFLKVAGSAVLNAAKTVGTWVAQTAVMVARTVANFVVMAARAVASFVIMAAGAVINAAIVAASWAIAFWPITLAIAAVIIIGLLLITHWKQVSKVAGEVWKAVSGFFKMIWKNVVSFIGAAINWVKSNWPLLLIPLIGPWALFLEWLVHHKDQVLDFFRKLPGEIGGFANDIFKAAENLGEHIVNGILGAFGSLAGQLLTILEKAIPGGSNGVIGKALAQITGIPQLASGGLVTGPTLAIIGEAGPELVVPLRQINGGAGAAAFVPSLRGGGGSAGADARADDSLKRMAAALEKGVRSTDSSQMLSIWRDIRDDIKAIRHDNGGVNSAGAVLRYGT